MGTPLVKFINRQDGGDGRRLYWGRADADGLPFRSRMAPPALRQDEYDAHVVRVADFRNAVFDIFDAEANKNYCNVWDGVVNGWFELKHIDRAFGGTPGNIYVEWVEYYLEDGRATPYSVGTEAVNAGRNGIEDPGGMLPL